MLEAMLKITNPGTQEPAEFLKSYCEISLNFIVGLQASQLQN